MLRRPLVYLDTNQWNYLDDGNRADGLGLDPIAFQRATRAGQFQIVASLDLIEEVINAIHRRPDFVGRVVPRILALAGHRLLRPIDARVQLEVKHGGMLPERKRYLPATERHKLNEIQADDFALRAIADAARQRNTKFKDNEEALRTLVITELEIARVPPRHDNLLDWYISHDREEWVRFVVEGGQRRGLYEIGEGAAWGYQQVPSVHTFVSYQQARIVHTVGQRRRIKPSDLDDAHHAAAGPYYDVLVTDDKDFGRALDIMPNLPFEWMTSAAFTAKYLDR